jgi:hypothetical protein
VYNRNLRSQPGSQTPLSITTLSNNGPNFDLNNKRYPAQFYLKCRIFDDELGVINFGVIVLNFVTPNVVTLNAVSQNLIMLNVVRLNVIAPSK